MILLELIIPVNNTDDWHAHSHQFRHLAISFGDGAITHDPETSSSACIGLRNSRFGNFTWAGIGGGFLFWRAAAFGTCILLISRFGHLCGESCQRWRENDAFKQVSATLIGGLGQLLLGFHGFASWHINCRYFPVVNRDPLDCKGYAFLVQAGFDLLRFCFNFGLNKRTSD